MPKPGRYLGTELNAVHKDWDRVAVRMAFAFPDFYEIARSHQGLTFLYGPVDEHEEYLLERLFAPAPDMEAQLRRRGLLLFRLESYRPLADFDLIGLTLQYELTSPRYSTCWTWRACPFRPPNPGKIIPW